MAQFDFGTINPNTKSGTTLANDLELFSAALRSQHSGSTRPSYAVSGMVWLDTSGTDPMLRHYDGTGDRAVYQLDVSDTTFRMLFSSDEAAYFKGGTGTNVLGFVSGSEVFRMDATGISVHSGAPSYALDVTGDVGFTANGAGVANGIYLQNNNGSGTASRIAAFKGLVLGADFDNNSPAANSFIAFETDASERARIDNLGNMLIGGTAAAASAAGALHLFVGTAPTGNATNGVVLYAEGASAELKVRDEAGNVTTLSPHNFRLIPGGASDEFAFAHYSEIWRGGKRVGALNIDMLRLARAVEKITGEQHVFIEQQEAA